MSKNTTFCFLLQFFTPERLEDFSLKIWLEFRRFHTHRSFLTLPRPDSSADFSIAPRRRRRNSTATYCLRFSQNKCLLKFKSLDSMWWRKFMPEERLPWPECSGDLRVMENRWTADTSSHIFLQSSLFGFRSCVLFKTWWCVTVGKCLHISCLYARCLDYGPVRNKIRQEVHHSTADFIDFSSPALIFRFTLNGIVKGI